MDDTASELLGPLLDSASRALAQFYLPPTLRRTGESLDGLPERLQLDGLVARLHTHDDRSVRGTYFIAGAPGGGKTTLTQHLQVRLLAEAEPSPCAVLDLARLSSLEAVPTEVRDLIIALRPNEVHEEKWWKKQAKKGRVVVVVDAWNEIQRWAEGKPELGRLLRALLFGNHRFNVLVTSRDELDDEGGMRTPERYVLEPLSNDEAEAFLVHGGLDPVEGMRAIHASGLELATGNPLLLTLVVGLLRDAPGHPLPRTRAGLFERTLAEAERRLGPAEHRCREKGLDLTAALVGCSILSLIGGTLTLPRADLVVLLREVWADQPVDLLIDALADKHLVKRGAGAFGETLTLIHESLREFALALAYRSGSPFPGWV